METKCLDFKVTLLKYFWNNRERTRIPSPTGIMKQKYMFFYNLFAKVNNKKYTFENLKAFKNGPVYYDIYQMAKNNVFLEKLEVRDVKIDKEIADVTLTLMYLYKAKMSTITHTFDLWNKVYYKTPETYITEEHITAQDLIKAKMLFDEVKAVKDGYEIYFNRYDVPMLFIKGKKNYIVNNYYEHLQFNTEDKCPIYVTEDEGDLCFD